jgi:hypothetical protein
MVSHSRKDSSVYFAGCIISWPINDMDREKLWRFIANNLECAMRKPACIYRCRARLAAIELISDESGAKLTWTILSLSRVNGRLIRRMNL